MLWDENTDDLVLAGAAKLYLYDAAGGEYLSSSGSALTIASGSAAWELPAADGSADQYLKTRRIRKFRLGYFKCYIFIRS